MPSKHVHKKAFLDKEHKNTSLWVDWLLYIERYPGCTRAECKEDCATFSWWGAQYATNEWFALEKRGLVSVEKIGRCKRYTLTNRGRQLLEQVRTCPIGQCFVAGV